MPDYGYGIVGVRIWRGRHAEERDGVPLRDIDLLGVVPGLDEDVIRCRVVRNVEDSGLNSVEFLIWPYYESVRRAALEGIFGWHLTFSTIEVCNVAVVRQ